MISFQRDFPDPGLPIFQAFPDPLSIINAERENRNTMPIWKTVFLTP